LEQQGHQTHIAELTATLRSLEDEKNKLLNEHTLLQRKMDGLIDGFVGSDLLGRKNLVITDPEPIDPANIR
jgi:hypothetical protein